MSLRKGTPLPVTDAQVAEAWLSAKQSMERQGYLFRDTDLGGPGIDKFGGSATQEKGLQALMDEIVKAVVEHFNAVPGNTILVRSQPRKAISEIPGDPWKDSYIRARFGIERTP